MLPPKLSPHFYFPKPANKRKNQIVLAIRHLEQKKTQDGRTSNGGIHACERKQSCLASHFKGRNAITALITDIEKPTGRVEGAMSGIVPHRRDFSNQRKSTVAVDGTNRNRIVQTIGDIEESP